MLQCLVSMLYISHEQASNGVSTILKDAAYSSAASSSMGSQPSGYELQPHRLLAVVALYYGLLANMLKSNYFPGENKPIAFPANKEKLKVHTSARLSKQRRVREECEKPRRSLCWRNCHVPALWRVTVKGPWLLSYILGDSGICRMTIFVYLGIRRKRSKPGKRQNIYVKIFGF